MHRELRDHLRKAKGDSGFVIALFLDVRGFSDFAEVAESSQAAIYLRKVYLSILDNYFPDAAFFKPTGDGLLIIQDYDEESLKDIASKTIASSLKLVRDFPELTSEDPMINFRVPENLGIGLARGAATRLVSDDRVLDYSGRPLNLAARLMDLARPRGLVIDETFGLDLLNDKLKEQFSSEDVYVKGIAEQQPIRVHFTTSSTVIPSSAKQPIEKTRWNTQELASTTLLELEKRNVVGYLLDQEPIDTHAIQVKVAFPKATRAGKKLKNFLTTFTIPGDYIEDAGKPSIHVDYARLSKLVRDERCKGPWTVTVSAIYPIS